MASYANSAARKRSSEQKDPERVSRTVMVEHLAAGFDEQVNAPLSACRYLFICGIDVDHLKASESCPRLLTMAKVSFKQVMVCIMMRVGHRGVL